MKNLITITLVLFSLIGKSQEWHTKYFVDDFGDKTSSTYEVKEVYGVFSNTATSQSNLTVLLYRYEDHFWFNLYEYNDYPVYFHDYSLKTISFKDEKGNVYYIRFKVDGSKIRVYTKKDRKRFAKMVSEGKEFKCKIVDGNSKYYFQFEY